MRNIHEEKIRHLSSKKEQLEWRRSKVVELKARGMNHSEIARELQVTRSCIVDDVQYLRNQAKESIKEYTTEALPEQYQICLCALDTILKHTYDILDESEDNREKLQAMEVFKDTHITKLELLSNATTIDSALNFIRTKQSQHKKESDYDDDNSTKITAATTTTVTAAVDSGAQGKQSVF
jgi:hypothetical protein